MQTASMQQPRSGTSSSLAPRSAARESKARPQPRALDQGDTSAWPAFQASGTAAHNATTAVRHGSGPGRRSSRTVRKRPAVQLDREPVPSGRSRESKMLKLALARSIVETKLATRVQVPQAQVFYPTEEQFANPIKYIAR